MKLGRLSVSILSDGHIKQDGGTLFGQTPKVQWEKLLHPDRQNRVRCELNCLLIQANGINVLVDTGIGQKEPDVVREAYGLGRSKLLKSLRDLGLGPRDIHLVILSHLHFDSCGGATKLDRRGDKIPTFPKAKYLVQRLNLEASQSPNERTGSSYHLDDFIPLLEKGRLETIDGDAQILAGLNVYVTNGHARGHQVVSVEGDGEQLMFLGDLIPTHHHLALHHISALDSSPDDSLAEKRKFLKKAEQEGWLIIFSRDSQCKAGYLQHLNGRIQLRKVDV